MLTIIQDSTHDSLNKNLELEIGVYVVLVLQLWCRFKLEFPETMGKICATGISKKELQLKIS